MKTIKFKFYSARAAKIDGRKMSFVEKLIDLRSELTHVEIQFDENRDYVSWSSTGADGANGCRFKKILYSHSSYWQTLGFVVSSGEEQRMWEYCCDQSDIACSWQSTPYAYGIVYGQDHVKYDYIGLLSFALESAPTWWVNVARWAVWGWTKFVKPDPNKMWCSEACSKAFNALLMKWLNNKFWPTEIDPGQMYETMKNMKGAFVL